MSARKLWPRVEELDEQVRRAKARLHEAEQARTASIRRLDAERATLNAYYEAVGAGEREPDDAEEARLLSAVQGIGVTVRVGAINHTTGAPELIDDRAEHLHAGAVRAVARAEDDVATFLRVHREALAAELAPQAEAARVETEAAIPPLMAAVEKDRGVRARYRRLMRANGLEDDLPPSPLRGWSDELQVLGGRVPVAIPESLRPRREEAAA